jgi:hypothetical protein
MPEPEQDDAQRQKGSESQRMREAAVSPKVPVLDSEAKPDHIEVRDDGTDCTDDPNAFRNLRSVEAGSDTESCYRMRRQ